MIKNRIGLAGALIASMSVSSLALADEAVGTGPLAKQYLGERDSCLDSIRIYQSRVIDDQTIVFDGLGKVYVSRLPVRCPGLGFHEGFSYTTSINKLCKQDVIRVINTAAIGATCPMGEFVELKGVKDANGAETLLKTDNLLGRLVAEHAFKELFPQSQDPKAKAQP